jgi:hypothetical protein
MPAAIPILSYNNRPAVKFNEEFRIKTGQEVIFLDEDLQISFVSVITDTRMSGLNSDITGNAEILLIIYDKGIETEICLCTGREPRSADVKNYSISLRNLFPYPTDNRIIFHSRYTAALVVRRKNKIFS